MRLALGLAAIVAVSLWLLPQWAPVEAEAWPPPNPGPTGVFAPNQALSAIAEIAVGPLLSTSPAMPRVGSTQP